MKNCIMLWKNDAVDLAINNQRRAFSDAYNNEVLTENKIYIELSPVLRSVRDFPARTGWYTKDTP